MKHQLGTFLQIFCAVGAAGADFLSAAVRRATVCHAGRSAGRGHSLRSGNSSARAIVSNMGDENRYRTLLRRTVVSQIAIVLILVACGLGFRVLSAQKPGIKSKETVTPPLNIDSFSVEPVSFREIITAYGTALPDREVVVSAQVNGQIVEVHPRLKVGHPVTAPQTVSSANEPTRYAEGDLLVRIDERDYANRVQQSKNRINEAIRDIEQLQQQEINSGRLLAKAKSDMVAFQQEYDRYRRAVDLNAGTKSELNRALVDLNRQKRFHCPDAEPA